MSDTPAPAEPTVDDTEAPDEPISTTDYDIEPHEDTPEAPAEDAAAEGPKATEEPEQADEPAEAPKDDLADLKAQVEALTAKLAEKEKAERAAAEHAEKVDALNAADIPDTFARFLSGDKDSWQEQINALVTLRGQASNAAAPSVPRDPAVDADLETDDDGTLEALEFFGFN